MVQFAASAGEAKAVGDAKAAGDGEEDFFREEAQEVGVSIGLQVL